MCTHHAHIHTELLHFKSPRRISPVLARFPRSLSQRCVRLAKAKDWFIYWRSVCSSRYCPAEEPPQLCMLNYHGNAFGPVQSGSSMWAAAKTKRNPALRLDTSINRTRELQEEEEEEEEEGEGEEEEGPGQYLGPLGANLCNVVVSPLSNLLILDLNSLQQESEARSRTQMLQKHWGKAAVGSIAVY